MNKKATVKEINAFLRAFKHSPHIVFLKRPKNLLLLRKLSYNKQDAIHVVKALKATDYHAGPKDDFDENRKKRGEVVWEFKRTIEHISVYIKLQVRKAPTGKAVLISFHEDEFEEVS